jgi:hypothetical protein
MSETITITTPDGSFAAPIRRTEPSVMKKEPCHVQDQE